MKKIFSEYVRGCSRAWHIACDIQKKGGRLFRKIPDEHICSFLKQVLHIMSFVKRRSRALSYITCYTLPDNVCKWCEALYSVNAVPYHKFHVNVRA